jgi:hypothetical protein
MVYKLAHVLMDDHVSPDHRCAISWSRVVYLLNVPSVGLEWYTC